MRNQSIEEEKFSKFYENWMGQLEEYLEVLLKDVQENNVEKEAYMTTINKMTAHHKKFYKVKWASEDVLAFFTPVWLTPLENAYLWISGWKPSMVFQLVESLKKTSLAGMTEEQARKIDALRVKIKTDEDKVEREMERKQMMIADREIVELVKLQSIAKRNCDSAAMNRVNDFVEAALKGLLSSLKNMMKKADCVRLKILKEVLELLSPIQNVNFLAAMSKIQIQMRRWGKIRDNK